MRFAFLAARRCTPAALSLSTHTSSSAVAAAAAAASFKILPDPVLFPDYYFYIRHPVALSDMARSMDAGRYSLADMLRDIRRMISNAKKYNKPEAVVYQDSLELEVRVCVCARACVCAATCCGKRERRD